MIRAVFLDWFHTLARFEPPREEVHSRAYREHGVEVPAARLVRGLLEADRDWFRENNRLKIDQRSREEQLELSLRYQCTALSGTGVTVPREQHLKVIRRIQELYQGLVFVLYDDVLPALKALKERRFISGCSRMPTGTRLCPASLESSPTWISWSPPPRWALTSPSRPCSSRPLRRRE